MSSDELLWVISEERRREAAAASRERLARPAASGVGRIQRVVGWLRARRSASDRAPAPRAGWSTGR